MSELTNVSEGGEEKTDKDIERFNNTLAAIGLDLSDREKEILNRYLRALSHTFKCSDAASPWYLHSEAGEKLEDHLLLAGFAEIELPNNFIALGCNTAQCFTALNQKYWTGEIDEQDELFKAIKERLTETSNPSLPFSAIIPINVDDIHWGAVFCIAEGNSRCSIFWGDSLRTAEPFRFLDTVKCIMWKIQPEIEWKQRKENYILDILNYEKQKDGYSCGFYVLSAVSKIARNRGRMPAKDYSSYSAALTEEIRNACTRKFVETVLELAKEEKKDNTLSTPSDLEVYKYLSRTITSKCDLLPGLRSRSTTVLLNSSSLPKSKSSDVIQSTVEGNIRCNFPSIASLQRPCETAVFKAYSGQKLTENSSDDSDVNKAEPGKSKHSVERRECIGRKYKNSIVHELVNEVCELALQARPSVNPSSEENIEREEKYTLNCPSYRCVFPKASVNSVTGMEDMSNQSDAGDINTCSGTQKNYSYPPNSVHLESSGSGTLDDEDDDFASESDSIIINGTLEDFLGEISQKYYRHFGAVSREDISKSNSSFFVKVRMNCVESRRGSKCTARIVAWRRKDVQSWRILRSLYMTHTHQSDENSRRSQRYKSVLKELREIEREGLEWQEKLRHSITMKNKASAQHLLPIERSDLRSKKIREQWISKSSARRSKSLALVSSKTITIRNGADVVGNPSFLLRKIDENGIQNYSIPMETAHEHEQSMKERESENDGQSQTTREAIPHQNSFNSSDESYSSKEGFLSEMNEVAPFSQRDNGREELQDEMKDDDMEMERRKKSVADALVCVTRSYSGMDSIGLIANLKHVSESFGYKIKIRRSEYYDAVTNQYVNNLTFECGHRNVNQQCSFELRLRGRILTHSYDTSSVEEDGCCIADPGEKEVISIQHVLQQVQPIHSHLPLDEVAADAIPPQAIQTAIEMNAKSRIRCSDIIRYLEDKYDLSIHRSKLRRFISYRYRRSHPLEEDCMLLTQNLASVKERNARAFYKVRLTPENYMHSVCWVLPKWREAYELNGIIPGMSIDCKSSANIYGLPLIMFTGRTNDGKAVVYLMGILHDQTEASMQWVMEEFNRIIPAPPRVICTDQDAALISAAKTVWPNSFHILDDWHLNMNQLKNVTSFLRKYETKALSRAISMGNQYFSRGRTHTNNTIPSTYHFMSGDLHHLRRSSSEEVFFQRRSAFEALYFSNCSFAEYPKWYSILYHKLYKMVVHCFNRTKCKHRFLFQGTGSSECYNSIYKNVVMDRRITLGDVPIEMERYTDKSSREHERDIKGISSSLKNVLKGSLLFGNERELDNFMGMFTNYAIDLFIKLSYSKSIDWYIIHYVQLSNIEGNETQDRQLRLFLETNKSQNILRTEVTISVIQTENSRKLYATCQCSFHASSGMPCRHICRAIISYPEYAHKNPNIRAFLSCNENLNIQECFHRYWKRERHDWRDYIIREQVTSTAEQDHSDESIGDHKGEIDNQSQSLMSHELSYTNKKALFDQLCRQAESLGPAVDYSIVSMLQSALLNVSQGRMATFSLPVSNPLQIDARSHAIQRRSVSKTATNQIVLNPSTAPSRPRGSTKRKRSFHERRGGGSRKKSRKGDSNWQDVLRTDASLSRAVEVIGTRNKAPNQSSIE